MGCPPLANEAYRSDTLDDQLTSQTKYVHYHDTWLQYDRKGNTLELTKLYDWYGGDFEQAAGSVLKYVASRSGVVDAEASPSIKYLPYDWSLNSVGNRQPR